MSRPTKNTSTIPARPGQVGAGVLADLPSREGGALNRSETAQRILDLIRQVNVAALSPAGRATMRLLAAFPTARRLRYEGRCHCRGHYLMSFVLPDEPCCPQDKSREYCGYYCPSCGFSNAGSRPKVQLPINLNNQYPYSGSKS